MTIYSSLAACSHSPPNTGSLIRSSTWRTTEVDERGQRQGWKKIGRRCWRNVEVVVDQASTHWRAGVKIGGGGLNPIFEQMEVFTVEKAIW